MKRYHLTAALLATLVLIAGLAIFQYYAGSVESQYIYVLAPSRFPQKYLGSALQSEAFRHPDLLPVYGSSELVVPDPYHVNKIFRLYPTGFTTSLVGNSGAEPLSYLLRLASVGTGLNGKKVVIILSPQFFIDSGFASSHYAGNYSRLQAYEFAFSTDLSLTLRHRVARRMLDYPDTLQADPVLRNALELLGHNSVPDTVLYYALLPLGKLNVFTFQLQDHWETLSYIWGQGNMKPVMPRRAARIDWQGLMVKAEKSYAQHATNNQFGFDNLQWDVYGGDWGGAEGTFTDKGFLNALDKSLGWRDLDLLLQTLKEMKAETLILGIPLPGTFADYVGVSANARRVYYQMLRDAIRPYGMPFEEFEDHENDNLFFYNPGSHLSSKAWIVFSRAIDTFYHDTPPGDGDGSK